MALQCASLEQVAQSSHNTRLLYDSAANSSTEHYRIYCCVLVTRHWVWIGNWIYWTLETITTYNQLQRDGKFVKFTIR
jgi:hypothetical protein